MFNLRVLLFLLIACLIFRSHVNGQVEFFEQNWSAEQRQTYYTTSQGSRMMPYSWFIALEAAESKESFVQVRLPAWGYLPNENSHNNPDKLPVGFVQDTNSILEGDPFIPEYKKVYVGLNCAACHTNQIKYENKVYQIDGAPTFANMFGMLDEIDRSLKAMQANEAKFNRFSAKVLGANANVPQDVRTLKDNLEKFTDDWSQFVQDTRVEHPWGRGRLDAFGMIFNRVSSIDLGIPSNSRKPNAPVSYPFVWGTSFQDFVQWNGSVPNTNDVERLGRNVGEVLGVFAEAQFRASEFLEIPRPARTSAKRLNLAKLENQLKQLWSPKWPENVFGELDEEKMLKGRALYETHCASCHQVVPHGEQNTPVNVVLTLVSEVKTDPVMATNAAAFTSSTGHLKNLFGGRSSVPRAELLQKLVRLSVISPYRDVAHSSLLDQVDTDDIFGPEEIKTFLLELGFEKDEALGLVEKNQDKLQKYYKKLRKTIKALRSADPNEDSDSPPALVYKAAPLAGIWATAPYLHNGSVPNLYELLLPASERTKTFHVGNNNFDPKHVGFEMTPIVGSTLLDTSESKPGNSNSGHDMYGTFTEEQRWQLIEYLKSL